MVCAVPTCSLWREASPWKAEGSLVCSPDKLWEGSLTPLPVMADEQCKWCVSLFSSPRSGRPDTFWVSLKFLESFYSFFSWILNSQLYGWYVTNLNSSSLGMSWLSIVTVSAFVAQQPRWLSAGCFHVAASHQCWLFWKHTLSLQSTVSYSVSSFFFVCGYICVWSHVYHSVHVDVRGLL